MFLFAEHVQNRTFKIVAASEQTTIAFTSRLYFSGPDYAEGRGPLSLSLSLWTRPRSSRPFALATRKCTHGSSLRVFRRPSVAMIDCRYTADVTAYIPIFSADRRRRASPTHRSLQIIRLKQILWFMRSRHRRRRRGGTFGTVRSPPANAHD